MGAATLMENECPAYLLTSRLQVKVTVKELTHGIPLFP